MLSELHYFVFNILPYIMVVALIAGIILRIVLWLRGRPGSKVKPASKGTLTRMVRFIITGSVLDLFLFRRMFRRSLKLWLAAWPMHVLAVILIFGGLHHHIHTYFFGMTSSPAPGCPLTQLPLRLEVEVPAIPFPQSMFVVVGIVFLFLLVLLFTRRVVARDPRVTSAFDNYFDVGILIILTTTGVLQAFHIGPYLPLITVHGLLAQVYVMSIPFTLYIHIIGGEIISKFSYEIRKARYGF